MNRRAFVRGIQLIVAITLITFTWLTFESIRGQHVDFRALYDQAKPGWLVVAAICALQEGVCGGLRIWTLGRVLDPKLKVKTAITSEFVLMFCAGVTPAQIGAPISQVAVLAQGGMKLVDVATAELMTGLCTITFFLATALAIYSTRSAGMFAVSSGKEIDLLLGIAVLGFGLAFFFLVACAAYPPIVKGFIKLTAPLARPVLRGVLGLVSKTKLLGKWAKAQLEKRDAIEAQLLKSVDECHDGFRIYLKRGKRAYLAAQLLTFGFFSSRFIAAYFILLGLGLPVEPNRFVAVGPPVFQVWLTQALLNFALYLSPTPGASGVAELGSNEMMSPWVHGPAVVPYLIAWRVLTLFLCMFVGGLYVFRYLGTDVLEKQVKEAEANKQKPPAPVAT
jgi:uncharacterized membrane protein YbhN (UPF0104 family)